MCVCVCVCVREREREREKRIDITEWQRDSYTYGSLHEATYMYMYFSQRC